MIAEEIQLSALVTDWSKVKAEYPAPGITRQMVVGQNVMMVRFTFDPFLITAEHTHPHEQMTLVLKGRVQLIISGEERIVSAGYVLHFPPHNRPGSTILYEHVVLINLFSPIREVRLN